MTYDEMLEDELAKLRDQCVGMPFDVVKRMVAEVVDRTIKACPPAHTIEPLAMIVPTLEADQGRISFTVVPRQVFEIAFTAGKPCPSSDT